MDETAYKHVEFEYEAQDKEEFLAFVTVGPIRKPLLDKEIDWTEFILVQVTKQDL